MKKLLKLMAGLFLLATVSQSLLAQAEVTVPQELIEEKVIQYLKDTTPLKDPKALLWVQVVKLPSQPIVIDGDKYTILMTDSRTVPLTFRTIVQVTISSENETHVIGVPVKMAVEKQVWVAKNFINARQPLSFKDIQLETKRLEYDEAYSLGIGDKPTLYTTKITVAPGAMLDMRKLGLTPAVYRNDQVRIVAKMSSGIEISFYGKALEDGAVGKNIRVMQVLANRKQRVYTGQVVDKNTVAVGL